MNQREPLRLMATQMANESTGYAVGENGTVLKTTDGGTAWSVMSTGVSNDFYGLYFNSAADGIVIGTGGLILRTTNGGSSWTPVSSGTTGTLRDAYILADGLGLIVGDGGTVLRSTNSGSSWNSVALGFSAPHLNAVYSIDKTTAYAVGDDGTILRGTNNGQAWEKLLQTNNSPWTTQHLRDVWFRDYVTGYAIGDNGTVLKTNERGETWETETINSTADLRSITFLNQSNAFIGGSDGGVVELEDESDKFTRRIWVDRLGRVAISQNTKQYNYTPSAYSYTSYDKNGRVVEVGEILSSLRMSDEIVRNETLLSEWLTQGVKREVTRTYYDVPFVAVPGFTQQNLRTRVATVIYQEMDGIGYSHATHFSYDFHGNVKAIIQDFPEFETSGIGRYVTLEYDYDLISNKITKISYQANKPDQYYHKYEYDGDNRITHVYTSSDNVLWDLEAKYFYYEHGGLARVEIGSGVQGIDYAYTIQNWLKGVNSNTLALSRDIGKDGMTGLNKNFAKDELGYSLGYFEGDYSSVSTAVEGPFALTSGSDLAATNAYNGNVTHIVTAISQFMKNHNSPIGSSYTYDQLNRVKSATQHIDNNVVIANAWGTQTSTNDYLEQYSYDPNGNILTQKRNSYGDNRSMDDLTYIYENKTNGYERNTNRLRHIVDEVDITQWGDLKTQPDNNYIYDEIGNLVKDNNEGISNIRWTVHGRVQQVVKTDGSTLTFAYDGFGNRVSKRMQRNAEDKFTYYVRDKNGNLLGLYERENDKLNLLEQPIYGNDKTGQRNRSINLNLQSANDSILRTFVGTKSFELKNHLGNVLAVVSDNIRAIPDPVVPEKVGGRYADVLSASNYSSFGALKPGLAFNSSTYRYGFNGMEKDDEIMGSGNSYTTFFRQYDPRLARWMSIDPKATAWESPYVSMGNNPMNFVDILGDSIVKFKIVETGATKYIHGETTLFIDHRIVDDMKTVIQYAIETKTHIHINSSFRTLVKQGSPSIQSAGVTPAKVGSSPHNGGFGIDFNVYKDNDVSKGTIRKNEGVTSSNPWLAKVKTIDGWRIGADFNKKDPVHIDGENSLSTPGFTDMVVENQKQMNGGVETDNLSKYVNRSLTVTFLQNGNHTTVDNGIQQQGREEMHQAKKLTFSAPEWAKNNIIGAHIWFIFTGNDPGLPDEWQDDDFTND
jgi:RHS repeat-associated protein